MLVAAKRARQINSYYHNLGEGTSTSSRRRWSRPARRTTSTSPSRRSPAARSSTTTATSVAVPPAAAGEHADGLRILLGVSGGIAAYKARRVRAPGDQGRATRCASCRRRRAARFVGAGVVRSADRRAGAGRRVRARPGARRLPRRPAAGARADLAIWSWSRNADVYLIAPASANTIAKLARRPGRQPADQLRARRDVPARDRAGDEQPHVRAPRDAGEPRDAARARRARSSSRRPGGWRRRASRASGRLAEPAELLAAMRGGARRAGRRRRDARIARGAGLRTGCACSSRPAARASRSTACASSATAPPGGWASRSPPRPRGARRGGDARRGERRAAGARRRAPASTSRPRPSWSRPPATRVRRLRRAADGRRRRRLPPGRAADGKIKKAERERLDARARADRPTCSRRSPPQRRAGPDAGRLRGRARRAGARARARQARRARASTRSSSTTSRSRTSASTPTDERGHDRHHARRGEQPRAARGRRPPIARGASSTRCESRRRRSVNVSETSRVSAHGERLRPLQARQRAARPRRLHQAAIVPLEQSARPRARQGLDPRGARPRAVPRAALRRRRARSSRRSPSDAPTNDYALFCLGRSMQLLGRHREACQPLALACSLRPERAGLPRLPRPRRGASAESAM